MIRPNPHIAALAPYALADLQSSTADPPLSLAQNESIRAPSPAALEAAAAAMRTARLYPDPDWRDLRQAIADVHTIPAEGLLCGAGSMELIAALAHAYAGPRAAVLGSRYGYAFFRKAAELSNAPFDAAEETEFTVSVDALLDAAHDRTGIVFLANPSNPTGTRLSRQEILRLRDGLPPDVLLVIDEAYGEFADGIDAPLFDLAARGDTIILRTFSKAYGLAGMRVGWGLFPPAIAADVRKLLNPNNIAVSSQAAATAAMLDQSHMRETCRRTTALRDRFADTLRRLDLAVPVSHTNFVLIDFTAARHAEAAHAALRRRGFLLRDMNAHGLPQCLRATIAGDETMDCVAAALADWRAGRIPS